MNQKMTRRKFGLLAVASAIGTESLIASPFGPIVSGLQTGATAVKSPQNGVVLTPKSFVINGRPEFLISGAIHFQRCPHELWRDRILKAKRAGINCIETYVSWNYHELEEGSFDFSGDRDIEKFIDICQDLGLYCFLRVGPFICGEWDCGGYPAWLLVKRDIEFRTMNQVALPYIRRWFEKLIPRIAARQITRGGPVILVQSENEWLYCDRPGGMEYLKWLIHTLRELGIEVPITDCNGFDVEVPESLKTIGFSEEGVARLRREHPESPVMVYEFYPGSDEIWGQPYVVPNSDPDKMRQETMLVIASRVMFNYYMFHGGTNFGFWASNTWKSDHSFITTRYFFGSPVFEGGALAPMYFAVKSANLLARNFNQFFCEASESPNPLRFDGPVRGLGLRSSQGYMQFVLPKYPIQGATVWNDDGRSSSFFATTIDRPTEELALQPGLIHLPSGSVIELAERSTFPMMLPYQLKIDERCQVDYSNATLLGVGGPEQRRVLILRGEPGRTGVISINGREETFVFDSGDPVIVNLGGVVVLGVSRDLADRTWFADGRILLGPSYVGERKGGKHECWFDRRTSTVHTISAEGELGRSEVSAAPPSKNGILPLTTWAARSLVEIDGNGRAWREISFPKSVEELGAYYGYSWYRASIDSAGARSTGLLFTCAADRLHVFQDGNRIGVWGRGVQATRDPLPVQLQKGANHFVFLCDNMGRLSEGKCNDRKGIAGNVYVDAVKVPLDEAEWLETDKAPNDSWEFRTYRCFSRIPQSKFFRIRLNASIPKGNGGVLALRWVPQYAWLHLNGQFIGEHGGDCSLISGLCFSEFVLDQYISGGDLQIDFTLYGEPTRDWRDHLFLFSYPLRGALSDWKFKRWEDPVRAGKAVSNIPTWWECEFDMPDIAGPLFLATQGLSKGQAYLNGRALGRYWEIGPQHSLYLPEPWFERRNRLAIFDEDGKPPDQTYIMTDPRSPVHSLPI